MPRKRFLTWLTVFACFFGGLAVGAYTLSRSSTFQLFGDLAARGGEDLPRVALTFDDGPSAAFTEEVLAILEAHNAKATFFLVGREIEENPEAARAIAAAGHEIGNHSYSHGRMVLKTPRFVRRELAQTDDAIRAAGYDGPIHFRPPYGKKLVVLPWVLAREGRLTVMWDIDGDGLGEGRDTPEAIAAHVVASVRPGSIVVLHAMYQSRAATRAALPAIIAGLRAAGYELVSVSALLGR